MKLRVGIIFGGKSAEHEVSLQSAKNIVDALDKSRFEVMLIGVDKQGQWHVYDADNFLLKYKDLTNIAINSYEISVAIVPGVKQGQFINSSTGQPLSQIDVIFPIIHGAIGEDGSLQGMLRIANMPFVGSDVLSSAICMDKDISKRLLRDAGLNVAQFITINRYYNNKKHNFSDIVGSLGLPLFVKPANSGSSVGVSKVTNEVQFNKAVRLAFELDNKVLVEQSIKGREIECAVLGNYYPKPSYCGEIFFINSDFYSYEQKYFDKNKHIIVPAVLNPMLNEHIKEIVIEAYQVLGCRGMARVDLFLTNDNKIVINEINTIPGFTNTSMYPLLWQANGISYSDLITNLIELALDHHDHATKISLK